MHLINMAKCVGALIFGSTADSPWIVLGHHNGLPQAISISQIINFNDFPWFPNMLSSHFLLNLSLYIYLLKTTTTSTSSPTKVFVKVSRQCRTQNNAKHGFSENEFAYFRLPWRDLLLRVKSISHSLQILLPLQPILKSSHALQPILQHTETVSCLLQPIMHPSLAFYSQ